MNQNTRIIVNTLAQHLRSLLNISMSLYSTRLITSALGDMDYGVYSLVAGVVVMLAFVTNAMVVTTQRQLSFYHGQCRMDKVRCMFANSLLLHVVLGALLAFVLYGCEPLLFNGFLNIEPGRIEAAVVVYRLVIVALLLSFVTAPYRAIFIARENIVYLSVVDVIDGVFRLLAAVWLLHCPFDRLISYAWLVTGITAFNMTALVAWAVPKFEESRVLPRPAHFNRKAMGELLGFAGWTVYSLGCIIGRTQGVNLILNQFFGTLINMAYGIVQQIFGSLQFVAQAVVNAISPQVIKAEGMGDRRRMLAMSESLSKYAYLLLAVVVIPLLFEMPAVLLWWLGKVPEYAVVLARFILIAALCDQLTIGLGTANQAIGQIRNYSLTINSIKLLTLPAVWFALWRGESVEVVMWIYLAFECICAIGRLPFLKYTAGLSIGHYAKHVFGRVLVPSATIIVACWAVVFMANFPYRFLVTGCVSVVTAAVTVWFFALEDAERRFVVQLLRNRLKNYVD